jgi:selT/selW/selH-like putative selenoprotein
VEKELKATYPDANVKLIKGSGGIFEVKCDNKVIYSKQQVEGQRFPNEGEITRQIKREMGKLPKENE